MIPGRHPAIGSWWLRLQVYDTLGRQIMDGNFSRLKRHYLPLLALTLVAGLFFYFNRANRNIITFITDASGFISLVMLSASLIIGPVILLLKNHNPLSTYFRRDLSITGGLLAVIHSVAGLFVHLRGKTWLYFLKENESGYSIRLDTFGLANYTGVISALIILLLIITSSDYMLKELNPARWKRIQRLAYLMFILIIIHCFCYRIGKQNLDLIYWFYLPVLSIVLIFQLIGVWLKSRTKPN
jgi:methionine sulfoxide reductase heme-binding subunit